MLTGPQRLVWLFRRDLASNHIVIPPVLPPECRGGCCHSPNIRLNFICAPIMKREAPKFACITFTLSRPSPRVFCYRGIGSCSHCVLIRTPSLSGSACLLQPQFVYAEENGPKHLWRTCSVKSQARVFKDAFNILGIFKFSFPAR